jgi:transposase-like protein
MQQPRLDLLEFPKKFRIEKAWGRHLFQLRRPNGFRCPRRQHERACFPRTRQLYECQACSYQASLTAGTIFPKTRTPLRKWFWMIFLLGRQKSGVSMLSRQRVLRIRTYKTGWTMGHKIRQALAAPEASSQLAGLLEMEDTYFRAPKPGKPGPGRPRQGQGGGSRGDSRR